MDYQIKHYRKKFNKKAYEEKRKKLEKEREKFNRCFKKIWDNFKPLREEAELKLLAEEL